MESLEDRKLKLKEHFPAAENHILQHAVRAPTFKQALDYLKSIYGNPIPQASAWAKPIDLSKPAVANPARENARNRAIEGPTRELFNVEHYKIKECKSRAGCNCDNFHHEFERRRDPNKKRYSEIPCPSVYRGAWRAPALCSKLDSCGHSHTVNESSYHPRIYKTKSCVKFDEGNCHYGTRCAFIHGTQDQVAFAWKNRGSARNRPEPPGPQQEIGIKLGTILPVSDVPVQSDLSASAWDFMPHTRNPLEEINQRMQKRVEDLYLKTLCSVCYVKEKNMALVPCGHLFCEDCITRTFTAVCPVCRRDYSSKLQVYL